MRRKPWYGGGLRWKKERAGGAKTALSGERGQRHFLGRGQLPQRKVERNMGIKPKRERRAGAAGTTQQGCSGESRHLNRSNTRGEKKAQSKAHGWTAE